MQRALLLICAVCGFARLSFAQYPARDWPDTDTSPRFEIYALASGMHTLDATPTLVINNPAPGQDFGFTPAGNASGARLGFVWRHENLGLMADLGFHKYADHTGSTSLAPLMVGLRVYSQEQFRTSFFGEGFAGAFRWSEQATKAHFTTVKGIVAAGGGIDIRLTRTLAFRLGEVQLMIASGPRLTLSTASGFAIRF